MSYEDIDEKLNAILELLKPKVKPAPVEEANNVTADYKVWTDHAYMTLAHPDKFTYIDGPHHGPAFIIVRRTA